MGTNEVKKIPTGSKVCVICHNEVTGNAVRVKDDFIINSIRSIKKFFRVSQNNQLFVCGKDLNLHREKRKKFERELLIISAIVIIVLLLLNGLPLISGTFQFSMFLSSIVISILIIMFAIIFKYAPAAEETKATISSKTEVLKGDLGKQVEKYKHSPKQKTKKGGS